MLTESLPQRINPRRLARGRAVLEGDLAIERMQRVVPLLYLPSGHVHLRLLFRNARKGRVSIKGDIQTTVEMICQYCLDPVELHIKSTLDLLVRAYDETADPADDFDELEMTGETVALVDVIEDEILLSLPTIAVHRVDCTARLDYEIQQEVKADKPFAMLAQLKRKS